MIAHQLGEGISLIGVLIYPFKLFSSTLYLG